MQIVIDIIVFIVLVLIGFMLFKLAKEEHESLLKLNKAKQEFYETMREYYKSDLVR